MAALAERVDVAFCCPMPMELRPLARRLSLRKARSGERAVYLGTAGGRTVLAMITGMGTMLAAAATERLLESVAVGHVVVVGITGAVDGDTPIGAIVRPELVIDGRTGTGYVPAVLGDPDRHGTMWTSDLLITRLDAAARLRAGGVVALDMETAAIAEVCERHGTPWSVVRAVSDRVTDGIVTEEIFRLNHADGTPDIGAVARFVVRNPGRIRLLAQLARASRLAAEAAAEAAISCSL